MQKMKVSLAAQVLSQRVAATLRLLANYGKKTVCYFKMHFLLFYSININLCYNISSDAKGTSEFLYFMDQVFDSVNRSSVKPEKGKTLRCAVTRSSVHVQFWNEA